MSEPFIAEIRIFAGNFAPRGFSFCDGQLVPIAQNTALFSLIGTTYGGDGRTTCGLPNLQGRTPMGAGNGPGLTPRREGQLSGIELVTLIDSELPSHSHEPWKNALNPPVSDEPGGRFPSRHFDDNVERAYKENATLNATFNGAQLGSAGGSQAHENRQPHIAINYIIAMQGLYPSRS